MGGGVGGGGGVEVEEGGGWGGGRWGGVRVGAKLMVVPDGALISVHTVPTATTSRITPKTSKFVIVRRLEVDLSSTHESRLAFVAVDCKSASARKAGA